MSQSKKASFLEALSNTFIGFLISLIMAPLIFWFAKVEISYMQMTGTTLLFTLVSVIRNYIVRRFFNKIKIK